VIDQIDQMLYPAVNMGDFEPKDLRITVLPCGFSSLDAYFLFKENEGELIIVGGRPSMGKSAFMFQLAQQMAKKHPVLIHSLEMGRRSIRARMLASSAKVPLEDIQRGRVPVETWDGIKSTIRGLKYRIDDRSGLNVYQISDSIRQEHRRTGLKVAVVDYLQIIKTGGDKSDNSALGEVTLELRNLAKELKISLVVGSQLNRQCEARGHSSGNFKPLISDLKSSGNIEQDADIVLLLYRDYYYTGERRGEADIIVAKNRNGSTGEVKMQFSETCVTFLENR
jgi:replicative DNA helicase